MKPSEVTRDWAKKGMRFHSHGGRHDIWENPATGARVSITRGTKDLPVGTLNAMYKALGLSRP